MKIQPKKIEISKLFITLFIGACMGSTKVEAATSMDSKVVRVRRNLSLPVDPLNIKTMADYDFTLLVSRNWFEYDSSRRALPGIIEAWQFNSKDGVYTFKISTKSRWSDGSQIKSSDLLFNLNRAFSNNSSYGKSVEALIDRKNLKIIDDLSFSIKMKNNKPSDAFFEKMGSAFLSLVHPKDTASDNTLKTNTLSCGPFQIAKIDQDTIILEPNKYFEPKLNDGPNRIEFKGLDKNFSFLKFRNQEAWENYVQTYSYLPESEANVLKSAGFPIWTRSIDRISLLRIGNGDQQKKWRESILKQVNSVFLDRTFNKLPLNITKATSLQPAGFPLHQKLKFTSRIAPTQSKNSIKILAVEGLATEFHREALKEISKDLKLQFEWDLQPLPEFVRKLTSDETYDLALVSFGVADPEPSTWMSLVIDSEFIQVERSERERFRDILKIHDRAIEVSELKLLLQSMYDRGSYIPLFWGSTISIGKPELSFERIRELDETVDLSKVIFKK